jgi:hypothetical protein
MVSEVACGVDSIRQQATLRDFSRHVLREKQWLFKTSQEQDHPEFESSNRQNSNP